MAAADLLGRSEGATVNNVEKAEVGRMVECPCGTDGWMDEIACEVEVRVNA